MPPIGADSALNAAVHASLMFTAPAVICSASRVPRAVSVVHTLAISPYALVVGQLHGVGFVVEGVNGADRAEHLLPGQQRSIGDVGQQGGFEEVRSQIQPCTAAGQDGGTGCPCLLDVGAYPLEHRLGGQ